MMLGLISTLVTIMAYSGHRAAESHSAKIGENRARQSQPL